VFETFRNLRGLKMFADLLGHGVREILELKVTVAFELKAGNRPPPKGGCALRQALSTITAQQ
jgi:hypothetical protein